THAAHVGSSTALVVLGDVGDGGFRGQQQAGDGGCVLQRRAGDLGRVENTHFDHVTVLAGGGVVAMIARLGAHFIDHHGRFGAAVVHDLAQRLFEGPTQDANAGFLVVVLA